MSPVTAKSRWFWRDGAVAKSAKEQGEPDGRYRRLIESGRVFANTHDQGAILAYIVDSLAEQLDVARGFAILSDEAGGLDFRVAVDVSSGSISDSNAEVSHTIVNDVARRRVPVLIRDASTDPVVSKQSSVIRKGMRSVMCAPMIARGQLVGVIYVDNLGKGSSFNDDDLNVLTLLSAQAGASLYNARLLAAGGDALHLREDTEKLTALSQMAAGTAHDLNKVLASILARLELIGMRVSEKESAEDVGRAMDAVQMGKKLVDQMSAFAQVGFAGPPSRVDMTQVVLRVSELLKPRLQGSGCTLELDLPEELFVLGQETQLRQIVMNLMTNALDAMPQVGNLSVSLSQAARHCVLCVRDTGCGIPDELKERLFEPFFTTKEGSTGLGLSLVHALVCRHGGTVAVESTKGQGSTFRVYLPLERPKQGA